MGLFDRLLAASQGLNVGRITGPPTSSNGASSFHLRWMEGRTYAEVAVTLEILQLPSVPKLYFWALQAGFSTGGRGAGAGHLGLQFHPDYPDARAVNWGGYGPQGNILDGSASPLPGTLGNPHTRDLRWRERTPYQLRIARGGDGPGGVPGWTGSITDLSTGDTTVIRELYGGGTGLTGIVVWSEVFADCDQPGALIRWSDFIGIDADGETHRCTEFGVNYQTHGDGGCANTNSYADGIGIVQETNTDRATPQGAVLRL